jgi:hypothetical protein
VIVQDIDPAVAAQRRIEAYRRQKRTRRRPTRGGRAEYPVAPLAALIREWLKSDQEDRTLANFAFLSSVPERRLYAILNGEQQNVTLGVADDIITRGLDNPGLFLAIPELARVYYREQVRQHEAA